MRAPRPTHFMGLVQTGGAEPLPYGRIVDGAARRVVGDADPYGRVARGAVDETI